MVDGASGWMHMMSAPVTGVGTPGNYAMVFSHLLTSVAKNAFGIEMVLEPFQARIIVWKEAVKILYGKSLHRYHSLPCRDIITANIHTVKIYILIKGC